MLIGVLALAGATLASFFCAALSCARWWWIAPRGTGTPWACSGSSSSACWSFVSNVDNWPELKWTDWQKTADTSHMWTQIVGKIRLALSPLQAHWWNVPLYVSARGLGISAMPYGRSFSRSRSISSAINCGSGLSTGASLSTPLRPQSAAEFYAEYQRSLAAIGVTVKIHPVPVELKNPIPFAEDHPSRLRRRRGAPLLARADACRARLPALFLRLRGQGQPGALLLGQLRPGGTRFSGRRAPARAEADSITREAYSHEVISAGFWPGNGGFGEAGFYSYAAPARRVWRRRRSVPRRPATTPIWASSSTLRRSAPGALSG